MTKARSNATANAAKGDLTVGNGTNLSGILPVGANGETIVADSSTSTGLRYQTGNGLAQGIINGGMDVWQRGTSFTNGGQYIADRWYFDISASTVTSTRESTVVPAGFQYSWKVSKSAGSATATLMGQTIETANAIQYAGKTVTVSFYAAADSSTTFAPVLTYSTSADNPRSGSWTNITPTVNGSTSVSTTTFVRIISTFAVPSTAKSLYMYIEPSIAASASIYVTGFQLEIGNVATTFRKAGGTIQGELAACQRYFQSYGGTSDFYGTGYNSTGGLFIKHFPVAMRIAPTGTFPSGPYTNQIQYYAVGTLTPTSLAVQYSNTTSYSWYFGGASGVVVGSALGWIGSAITLSSEL